MATRRKKASTRVRARQASKPRKKAPLLPKRGKKVVPRPKPKKTTKKPALKKRVAKKPPVTRKVVKKKTTKKPALKKRKVVTKQAAPKLPPFERLRARAIKEHKMMVPHFPKRMGRSPLRGTDRTSKQRDVFLGSYWEDVREGWLLHTVKRIFASLLAKFKEPPTLYGRFTFSLDNIRLLMAMGSPKLLTKSKKGKLNWWYVSVPVSYTLDGAMYQFETTLDKISSEIRDTRKLNPRAIFFLEYVTLGAYILGHQA